MTNTVFNHEESVWGSLLEAASVDFVSVSW